MDKPDLVKVLMHYGVDLNPDRVTQLVLCPILEETRPSCSVNTVKQVWSCKGCGAQGDSLTLIQIKEGLERDFGAVVSFAEANFGVAGGVPARGRGRGVSRKPGASRGGYRPRLRGGVLRPDP